jgi:hypothetical protein
MRTSAMNASPSSRRASHSQLDVTPEGLDRGRAVRLEFRREIADRRPAELIDRLGSVEPERRGVAVDEALVLERSDRDGRCGPFKEAPIEALRVGELPCRALLLREPALEVCNGRRIAHGVRPLPPDPSC